MRPSEIMEKHRDEVRAAIARHRVSNARLFGSVARGEDTVESDIDILVELPDGVVSPGRRASGSPNSMSTGRNYDGPWRRTPGRLLGTGLVRFYQLTFSPLVGGHCRHVPTCSEYAYEAVALHGLLRGGWLSVIRVARCGPFGKGGHDPVPPA